MRQFLHFDYTALIIYFLLLVAWLLRSRTRSGKRSIYFPMLIIAVITNIFDIFSVLTNVEGTGYIALKYFLHCGYLISRNLMSATFLIYVFSVTETWHVLNNNKKLRILISTPISISILLIATSPLTHFMFYINDAGVYVRGRFMYILYISAVFYLLSCIYYCLKYKELLRVENTVPIFSIIPSQVLAVIIQLFFPNILCEMLASSLCLLFIMIIVERPEEMLDTSTGLLKSQAFIDMAFRAEKIKRPYCIVIINITNYTALSSYLSIANMNTLFSSIGRRLEAVCKHLNISADIYDLENGLFGVTLFKNNINLGARFATHALDTLRHDYTVSGLNITVLPNISVIKVPDDIDDAEQLRILLLDLRNSKYTGEINLASSFTKNKDYSIMAKMDAILNDAIENDKFEVYYQPIFSNEENRFNSAEALIRLNTAEHGFIRPDLFIPMAEESGAIHEIGMIVLEKVCNFISSDSFKKLGLDYIEVNLSVEQCMDKSLVDKVTSVCKKYNVMPSQLNFEITETSYTFAQKNMLKNINALYNLGFSFSLDDFGTGYSNMVRIASLPLQIVKLDRSFTWTKNNNDLKLILENTINMIKKMDLKIVVEGVETKEMLDSFNNLKCEYIQGYYFSKPLPEFDFVHYIEDNQTA